MSILVSKSVSRHVTMVTPNTQPLKSTMISPLPIFKGIAMITFKHLVFVTIAACLALPTVADPYKDENGKGYYKGDRRGYKGGEHKEEYWDGNCKVERKWEKNGKYKEERKCEGPRAYGNYPPPDYREHGVLIQPPGIIIQLPAIIVR